MRPPKRFLDEALWPELQELNATLTVYLGEVTERVIAQGIEADSTEVEVKASSSPLRT